MSRMLYKELDVMQRRGVPETDPRVVAIKRTLEQQSLGQSQRRAAPPKPRPIQKPVSRRAK